ncbi:hypothetical protein KKD52_10175 [Myxococcota bacterium]|nr:hypothetical protein [Myxococcota bacterium]
MTPAESLSNMQRKILDALSAGAVDLDDLCVVVGGYCDVRLWRSAVETLIGMGMIRVHNAKVELVPRTIFPTDRGRSVTWTHWDYFSGGEA